MSNNIAKREPSIKNKQAVNVAKKMGKRYSLMDAALAGKRIGIKWQYEKFTVGDLLVGMHYELEHGKVDPETNVTGDNVLKTAKIAWAHLKERPDYYVHLMKIDPPHKLEKKASEILDEMCMEKEASIMQFLGDVTGRNYRRAVDEANYNYANRVNHAMVDYTNAHRSARQTRKSLINQENKAYNADINKINNKTDRDLRFMPGKDEFRKMRREGLDGSTLTGRKAERYKKFNSILAATKVGKDETTSAHWNKIQEITSNAKAEQAAASKKMRAVRDAAAKTRDSQILSARQARNSARLKAIPAAAGTALLAAGAIKAYNGMKRKKEEQRQADQQAAYNQMYNQQSQMI